MLTTSTLSLFVTWGMLAVAGVASLAPPGAATPAHPLTVPRAPSMLTAETVLGEIEQALREHRPDTLAKYRDIFARMQYVVELEGQPTAEYFADANYPFPHGEGERATLPLPTRHSSPACGPGRARLDPRARWHARLAAPVI